MVPSSGSTDAHRQLAFAYLVASKLAAKTGDRELDWLAAERGLGSALVIGDRDLAAVMRLQVASAFLNLPGRREQVEEIAAIAEEDLSAGTLVDDAVRLSAEGSLWLFRAAITSRSGRRAETVRYLDRAADLARRLGRDGNELWTAFGPTNVALHRIAALNALARPEEAIVAAGRIDTARLPAPLLGRRAQVHLDLATAFTRSRQSDPAAVLHLLEAERLAPQTLRVNHRPRVLLNDLLARERRTSTPGLRALAARSGIHR